MNRYKALSDRVRRQEALRGHRVRRQTIYMIYGNPRPIIAFKGFTATIARHHGESYERFKSRALAKLRDPIIMAVYADRK